MRSVTESHLDNDRSSYFTSISKDKIANTLSWPIGAKDLKEAIARYLEPQKVRLQFVAWQTFLAGRRPNEYPVLRTSYSHEPSTVFTKCDANLKPTWIIWVHAVPREDRHSIKTALLKKGLPALTAPRLKRIRKIDGNFAALELRINWDANSGTLSQSEHPI